MPVDMLIVLVHLSELRHDLLLFHLIQAKGRVAPIKKLSILLLELFAALHYNSKHLDDNMIFFRFVFLFGVELKKISH